MPRNIIQTPQKNGKKMFKAGPTLGAIFLLRDDTTKALLATKQQIL